MHAATVRLARGQAFPRTRRESADTGAGMRRPGLANNTRFPDTMRSLFMLPLYRHAVVFLTALLLAALPLHAAESNPPAIELLIFFHFTPSPTMLTFAQKRKPARGRMLEPQCNKNHQFP